MQRLKRIAMKVAVIGLGYIGLPTACLLAKAGNMVSGVEIDDARVKKLNAGILPFHEGGLEELFEESKKNLSTTTDIEKMRDAESIIICVPTPMKHQKMDWKYIDLAVQNIIKILDGSKKRIIILESTSAPGTTRAIAERIQKATGFVPGKDFYAAYCPERAIPGNTINEMRNNDRIIGGIDKTSTDKAVELYATFVKGTIYRTDATTAEMVKLCENTYRDVNISIANEYALIAEKIGVNIYDVIEFANKHPRVNILQPTIGVGGHCLPLDPWFLTEVYPHARIIPTSRQVNDEMLGRSIELIKKAKSNKVCIFGMSYKPNVDDARESAGGRLAETLEGQGLHVAKIDPHAYPNQDPYKEAVDADFIVICTKHDAFKRLDWCRIREKMSQKRIYDGVRLFENPPEGFRYWCLGRGDLHESP